MKIIGIVKDAIVLFFITLVLVTILSLTKVGTEQAIDRTNKEAKLKAFSEVCPGYFSSEDIANDVVGASAGYDASLNGEEAVLRCKNESGEIIGYIVQCTANGYGGPLNLIVGFDKTAKITGVRYANLPSETPGLGMKTTEQWFLDSWLNHSHENVSEVDTISGATRTSSAFKQAVSLACMFADRASNMDGGK